MRYSFMLGFALCFFLVSCSNSSKNLEPVKASSQAETSPEKQSEAWRIAHQVKADLDVTTLEQMMIQMPAQPTDIKRQGSNRVFTWIFSDGSKIVATFRPKGNEGSGQGLVLYMIDIAE